MDFTIHFLVHDGLQLGDAIAIICPMKPISREKKVDSISLICVEAAKSADGFVS